MNRYFVMLLCMAVLIAGCQQSAPIERPLVVCGDHVCSAEEAGRCEFDCEVRNETPKSVISELQRLNRTRPSREEVPTVSVNRSAVLNRSDNISIAAVLPGIEFRVASRYNLLSIGENLSKVMGTLTGAHLPNVLRGGRLSSNTMAFGPRAAFYEQRLSLRAGRVVFGEEDGNVTTFLEFSEGEPIFDYLLTIRGGTFKFFESEAIRFLGHDYFIYEVTNTTMTLKGLTTPDEVILRNGRGALVNKETVSNEVLNVTFTRDFVRVIVHAPEDLRIVPGAGLVSLLDRPEVLLTNKLDLAYEGLTPAPCTTMKIDRAGSRYRLEFTNNLNMSYKAPLATLNPLRLGDGESSLVFQEGNSSTDYNIQEDDYFIINNNRRWLGLSNVLRLVSIKEEDQLLLIQDPALENFYIYFTGTPGVNATADLIVYNVRHRVHVGNGSIAVDLDGDGQIARDRAPIVTAGSSYFLIESASSDSINLTFVTPREARENSREDLRIRMSITDDGVSISEDDLVLEDLPRTDDMVGLSDFGTMFLLKDESGEQTGEELFIEQPFFQRFADVVIKAYD